MKQAQVYSDKIFNSRQNLFTLLTVNIGTIHIVKKININYNCANSCDLNTSILT